MPVPVLKARYTEAEFREHLVRYSHEPLPGDRLDWWGAHLVASVLAPWRKKGARAPSPKTFLPDWWEKTRPRKPQSAQAIGEMLKAFTQIMGGDVKKGKARGTAGRKPGDHPQRKRGAAHADPRRREG